MYAKSFLTLDGNGRLTGARTAQTAPYDRYTCLLRGSVLQYHPEYATERPWFEHRHDTLTENGRQHCPYVDPGQSEIRRVNRLQRWVPHARPVIHKAEWYCSQCDSHYYGERYCLICHTGEYSTELNVPAEVSGCAC